MADQGQDPDAGKHAHLRGAGVGISVAVGRIGAIVGTLALPSLAVRAGAAASYLIVGMFWLVGVAAIGIYAAAGGPEAARRRLEALTPKPVGV